MKSRSSGRCLSLFMCLQISIFSSVVYGAKAPQLHKEIDLRAELTGKNLKHMSDDELYVEFLSQYQRHDRIGMKRAMDMMLQKHRSSPHADNTLYIMGYSALEKKQFAEALNHFQFLLKNYPGSNKAVSAEFAKGVAYKNMKLKDLAQKSFMKVRQKFPGSPESFRAESELKLLVRR